MVYRLGISLEEIKIYEEEIKGYLYLWYKSKDEKYLNIIKSIEKTIIELENNIISTS